ncbi:NifC-like protein [Moorella sp. E308F]|uniref:ABC transporter permease n=1 Tax=unclassified Neomoorella TaxID=2676739 RepID=UPI0010FFB7D8|nr:MULTISPECIES: ABC transporter permease [unclassified Moorella (in: firmicutes)]GEA13793.1 NifC-like protein [Moorella sp. E308F]GEA18842.1 NifC-like protein [Moorella sp. E306M]
MGAKLFKMVNVLITSMVVLFILAAVSTVLIRGIPYIPASLKAPELVFAIRLSLITSIVSTTACLLVAMPVAYTLARYNLPGQGIAANLLRIPLTLPPVVSGVCLLLLFGTTTFGEILTRMGLRFVFTVPGIILAQFFVNLPSLITVLKAAIEAVDIRLEYVARTLGCTPSRAFLKVTLPLIRNNILAGLVLTWGKALGEFGAVLMLAGATRFKTETLPISLYLNMATGDMEALMASAAILILIAVISLAVFERAGVKLYERVPGL